ncbi:acyltransferase family protein [Labrys monachus]|uniref:Peptidoglycan/LPS O-acetylase OafA/YrhL n=1 Tax=Labrys monachus TaxID=217067 RepID=A0ABU0FKX1_9HYPH|nr:acyltransferase [Labrys monachus]MDQ0394769.1 peptidoglycan/LPS O-acetylase OafA/YrhL [Labrys monachus]
MPTASLPTKSPQIVRESALSEIDVYRGVAALGVAALHIRELTWIGVQKFWHLHGMELRPGAVIGYMTFPLVWGSIGVPVFFVLSGYCIHQRQAVARSQYGSFCLSPGNFLARRLFRVYPVLIAALFLTLICDYTSGGFYPGSDKLGDIGFRSFIVNIFSLQGAVGRTYGSNGALWTLSVEVQFYILYPLLLVVMSRCGIKITAIALLFGNILSYFLFERLGFVVFSSYYFSWYLGVLLAEGRAIGFMSKELSFVKFRFFVYTLSAVLLVSGCLVFFVSQYISFQIWAFSCSIFLLARLNNEDINFGRLKRTMAWIGAFSFSLYITHLPVSVLVCSILFRSERQMDIYPFFLCLAIAVLFGYIFFLVFERPALGLSRLFRGGQVHSASATRWGA